MLLATQNWTFVLDSKLVSKRESAAMLVALKLSCSLTSLNWYSGITGITAQADGDVGSFTGNWNHIAVKSAANMSKNNMH